MCAQPLIFVPVLFDNQEVRKQPLPPKAELQRWYQFYSATERGRAGYDKNRHDFAKLIWQLASPKWNFHDATFARSAAAFDDPDHVSIVIPNARRRLGLATGEPKDDELEKRLAAPPPPLIIFCTYSYINWLRTLPYVRALADKYQDQGLVMIGRPQTSLDTSIFYSVSLRLWVGQPCAPPSR
jgi:hypothetical protein